MCVELQWGGGQMLYCVQWELDSLIDGMDKLWPPQILFLSGLQQYKTDLWGTAGACYEYGQPRKGKMVQVNGV
jgi:hypothetical protein